MDWITDMLAVGNCESPHPAGVAVLDLRQIPDHCSIPSATFDAVMATIASGMQTHGKVMLHCLGGISRSCIFAAVWLAKQGSGLDAALSLVQSKRPVMWIHPDQMASAKRYLESAC